MQNYFERNFEICSKLFWQIEQQKGTENYEGLVSSNG